MGLYILTLCIMHSVKMFVVFYGEFISTSDKLKNMLNHVGNQTYNLGVGIWLGRFELVCDILKVPSFGITVILSQFLGY